MPDQAKINFYPFSDGAALHRVGSHNLFVLNHSSAVLWCLFEELGAGGPLIQAYAEHFRISKDHAEADVHGALVKFEELVNRSDWSKEQGSGFRGEDSRVEKKGPRHAPNFAWQKKYEVAGIHWVISCDKAEEAEEWFDCFAHLEAAASDVDLHYAVVCEGEGWTVASATEESSGLAENEVLPSLMTLLFGDLCASLSQYLLLHAAVATKEDCLVMFPGESAFGKSTLSTALAASGWTLYSDELAPLDAKTLEITPFVMPVGIKSRSLPVLQSLYPEIEEYTAWQRADGQVVRYLAPPQIPLADPAAVPKQVSAMIFPRFIPGAETSIEKLTPLQALELLANTGSSERALEVEDVKALLELAEGRPCWSLVYSDLDEAIESVGQVTSDQ